MYTGAFIIRSVLSLKVQALVIEKHDCTFIAIYLAE
jgi:hypothetical protein